MATHNYVTWTWSSETKVLRGRDQKGVWMPSSPSTPDYTPSIYQVNGNQLAYVYLRIHTCISLLTIQKLRHR